MSLIIKIEGGEEEEITIIIIISYKFEAGVTLQSQQNILNGFRCVGKYYSWAYLC